MYEPVAELQAKLPEESDEIIASQLGEQGEKVPVVDESENPELNQIDQLSTSLSELNYPEKMREIDELREKLQGSDSLAELEKYNIELNVHIENLQELFEPLLFQLERIFTDNESGEPEASYNTLHEQYLRLKQDAEKIKNLPQDVKAAYVTRKAIFTAISRATNIMELEAVLEDNDALIFVMKMDFEEAGKFFKQNYSEELKVIAELLRNTGNADQYDWSKLPSFLANKIKELSAQYIEETSAREEKREKKAAEFLATLDSSANTLWLQKGLFKLGELVPAGSTVDCEELSIIVEAFWLKVSFSGPEKGFEELIPAELNFPPLNKKLVELLPKHPAYLELKKIKEGEYNDNVDELIAALKKINSSYVLVEGDGTSQDRITAWRMALILLNLQEKWDMHGKAERSIAGVNLGKRRLSKNEIREKLTSGSLSYMNEPHNIFLLNAMVEAFDKVSRK